MPAFFIAGAIGVFVSDAAVMRYLGAGARRSVAYVVAAVSGTLLAVCSCTVLPLFAGIHRRGAGLGPATAFLYSGPAINVMAVALTAGVLGWRLGLARAVGAVVFAVVIGLAMELVFHREEAARARSVQLAPAPGPALSLGRNALLFTTLTAILVFANWGRPAEPAGLVGLVFARKWLLTAVAGGVLAVALAAWFGIARWKVAASTVATLTAWLLFPARPAAAFAVAALALAALTARQGGVAGDWFDASWGFARQILPLLFAGVFVAGMLLGRPGAEGLIPSAWIGAAVGGNSLSANLFAAVAGALMYFATLTEVPIVQGLVGSGMGQGPALALLLAGPALSLPNMLVIASVLGWRKTSTYVALVVAMATVSGLLFGALVA